MKKMKIRRAFYVITTLALISFTVVFSLRGEQKSERPKYMLVIHGGAGAIDANMPEEIKNRYYSSLRNALEIGEKILKSGGKSLDAVEAVVNFLEDDSMFNAGKGAVLNSEGYAQLDASIMDGKTLNAGAVAAVEHIKNPISGARVVMEKTKHVMMTGAGAEKVAELNGLTLVDRAYFITSERTNSWNKANSKGTVGCAALDMEGNLAAATSTGGMTNKLVGRIGDSPIIGAGTYANNKTLAISATGKGEKFIKYNVAFRISALMEYKDMSLEEACNEVMFKQLEPNDGGIVAVDKNGNFALVFNTESMFRGVTGEGLTPEVKIWKTK
jgi:beta-aspartyl-peptidase (threonine type)